MQILTKTSDGNIESNNCSLAEFSAALLQQAPITVPVEIGARRSWTAAQPKILFGVVDGHDVVTARNALTIRLGYIKNTIKTPEDLNQVIASSLGTQYLLLMDVDSELTPGRLRANLIIPLDKPLTLEQHDDMYYSTEVRIMLKFLRSQGVMAQIPRLRKNEWSQWLVAPVLNQATSQLAFCRSKGAPMPTEDLRQNARRILIETAEPTGMVKEHEAANQYLEVTPALDVLQIFAKLRRSWLRDPIHQQATLLHLRVAANDGKITRTQAEEAIRAFAEGDIKLSDRLLQDYEKTRQTSDSQVGLRFFVQQDALSKGTPWLEFSAGGHPKVNPKAFARYFLKTHHFLTGANLPGSYAYFYEGHWTFGREAYEHADREVGRIIGDAIPFTLTLDRTCMHQILDYGEEDTAALTKATSKGLGAAAGKENPFTNASDNLIEFANCTYNIATDKFSENRAENFQMRYVPRRMKTKDFVKPVTTIGWLKALVGHDEDAFNTLVRFIGYCFMPGYPHQIMLFLLGSGGNGKSHFLNYLSEYLLGGQTSSVSWSRLTNPDDRFATIKLANCYANIASDMDTPHSKAAERLKELTGDTITVEEKGQPAFEVKSSTKLIFATNHLPSLSDHQQGFKQRVRIVRFPLQFRDSHGEGSDEGDEVEKKFPDDKIHAEASDFIHYAIRQYVEANAKNRHDDKVFPQSDEMKAVKEQWLTASDSVGRFIRDYVVFSSDLAKAKDGDSLRSFYAAYKQLAINNGSRPAARTRLVSRICDTFSTTTGRTERRYRQFTRIFGVTFKKDAIGDLKEELGDGNMPWLSDTYYYDQWCQEHPNQL